MRFGNIGGSQNLLQASTVCIIASAGHSKRFGSSPFRGVCQTNLGTDDAALKSDIRANAKKLKTLPIEVKT